MPRASSRSVRPGLPPCGGMLRMPLSAVCVRLESPCAERCFQACRSPILGARSLPAPWQAMQVDSTTSLPLRCALLSWEKANAAHAASAIDATFTELLGCKDVLHRRLDLGLGGRDLRMAFAILQLGDDLGLGALALGGDVLERGPDLLLVHLVAAEAALGLHDVGARLGLRGTGGEEARGGDCEKRGFHSLRLPERLRGDCTTHERPAGLTVRARIAAAMVRTCTWRSRTGCSPRSSGTRTGRWYSSPRRRCRPHSACCRS